MDPETTPSFKGFPPVVICTALYNSTHYESRPPASPGSLFPYPRAARPLFPLFWCHNLVKDRIFLCGCPSVQPPRSSSSVLLPSKASVLFPFFLSPFVPVPFLWPFPGLDYPNSYELYAFPRYFDAWLSSKVPLFYHFNLPKTPPPYTREQGSVNFPFNSILISLLGDDSSMTFLRRL